MSSGAKVISAFIRETVAGTTPASGDWSLLKRTSWGVKPTQNKGENNEIGGSRMAQGATPGTVDVGGDVGTKFRWGQHDDFLASCFGAEWSGDSLTMGNERITFSLATYASDVGIASVVRGAQVGSWKMQIPNDGDITATVPFNDSMDMITGFGPGYKKITVRDDVVTIPSDKIVPFSRASSATYINKSGALTIAEINEPRFEKEGLLIEGQRTNYFTNSNAPELWNKNPGLKISETKTDSRGFKYATFTPEKYLDSSGSYGIISGAAANKIAVVKNDAVTISFRAKGDNVRFAARFDKGDSPVAVAAIFIDSATLDTFTSGADASNIAVKNVVRDGEWVAVEAVYKVTDDSTYINGAILMSNKLGANFDKTSFMDVTTPQIELGSCLSSFIVTPGVPATRASDMVIFSTRNNISSVPLSCLVEIHKNWDSTPNQAPRILTTIGVATNDEQLVLAFRTPTSPDVEPLPYVQFGVRSAYLSPSVKAGRKMIAGFVCNSSTEFRCCCNGYLSPVQTSSWKNTGAAHEIRIGGTSAGGERHLFGHVRNLRIWHKELTDAQMGESIK
ncbi:phage tail tube protein [Escherichia coli]